MEELAHAKVNLSLRVLRKREDGFHEIETVMAPISLHDSLHFAAASNFSFQCDDPGLPLGEDNLVVRAARLFFAETCVEPRIAITLTKRIPHGAGLGGGSSDAAASLRGLNRFFEAKLPPSVLQTCAAEVGSDVPFFLHEKAAICRGRGELISLQPLPKILHLALLKPQFGVPTPWAYSRWTAARRDTDEEQAIENISFVNDLEQPVHERFPFLATLKSWLRAQPEVRVSLMSGSGSTVFAVVDQTATAVEILARAKEALDPLLWAFAGATLSASEA